MTSGSQHASREEARAAKVQVGEHLAALPGVVGLGLAKQPDGGWGVRVNVTTEEVAQAVRERLSTRPRAAPVHVRVTGAIRASAERPEA
ncbi:MAG TPA: hypothetical protein H9815_04435 [Candidatus Ruania gallistercoris]|uniref:Uncharacterized protein n=1 Tax=Candidatus Ruania gallistercoris TaxID=2838746 RepID=A0A9D2J460_9MICO|nr:hypothetical protein [Candidatus Ruania gallistercoris]